MQHVAVIGAGAGGLCCARYLSAKPNVFKLVVFEKADCIGGTWVYTEETGTTRHGLPIHSSMYKNLKTNLPKEVMCFPDTPFDLKLPSFVTHKEVHRYLDQYAAKFDLLKYIQFQTVVETVKPVTNGDKTRWAISVRDLNNKEADLQTSIFDAVMVCNGHYSIPSMAPLTGQETFTGTILHSHSYCKPEDFKDSTVVVVGAGRSGQDIMLDLSTHASNIYVSHWKATIPGELPSNITQVPAIKSIHGNAVTFTDGQIFEVDHIILCTGYKYSFPFLDKNCGVTVIDNRVAPLYKHLIHADYHSLSFIGLPICTAPFSQFTCQAQLVIAILEGTFKLPSRGDIDEDNRKDLQKRLDIGWPYRYFHKMMCHLQWEYNNTIAQLAGVSPIKPVVENLYKEVAYQRHNDVWHYKGLNYTIVDDQHWCQIEDH